MDLMIAVNFIIHAERGICDIFQIKELDHVCPKNHSNF
jgi:hypothetical protein